MKISKKKKSSYRHGDLRNAILQASLQIVEKIGLENLSLREVAKKAGVTHQAPYRHFKDKEDLLAALAADGFEKLAAEMTSWVAKESAPYQRLLKIGEGYFDWAYQHPAHFRLMFSKSIPEFGTSPALSTAAGAMLQLTLSVVDENQAAGVLRIGETRPLARQIWAAVHGATLLFIDRQFKPLGSDAATGRALVVELIASLVNGLGPAKNR